MMVQRTNLRHRYAGICKSQWYVGRHQCTKANGMLISPQCVRCDIGIHDTHRVKIMGNGDEPRKSV